MNSRADVIRLRTPEGVAFSHKLASPVLRMLALVVDWMIVSAGWGVAGSVLAMLAVVSEDMMRAVAVVGYFVVSLGYWILFEWRWRGQTIGKRMLKLRVIDARGLRLTPAQVIMRNLLRAVDGLPAFYLVGGVAALLNRRGQRLGDLAAGTLVVWEPSDAAPDADFVLGGKYNTLRAHAQVVARLRQAVSPEEARVAWQAVARRDALEDGARVEVFARLAERFKSVTSFPSDAVEGVSDEQFVRNVVDVLFVERRAEKRAEKVDAAHAGARAMSGVHDD